MDLWPRRVGDALDHHYRSSAYFQIAAASPWVTEEIRPSVEIICGGSSVL
jgi:hypothetical protein